MLRRRKITQRPGGIARQLGKRLPKSDRLATLTSRATDRLFHQRATKRRAAECKQRRGRLYRIGGLAGAGLVAGWTLAAKRGAQAWQVAGAQFAKAGQPLTRVRQRMTLARLRVGVGTDAGTSAGERNGAPSPVPASPSMASDKDKQPAKEAEATTNSDR